MLRICDITVTDIQILDVIDLLDKAPVDADNPYRRIFKHIENLRLDFVKLLSLANNFYNKDVVLKLRKLQVQE